MPDFNRTPHVRRIIIHQRPGSAPWSEGHDCEWCETCDRYRCDPGRPLGRACSGAPIPYALRMEALDRAARLATANLERRADDFEGYTRWIEHQQEEAEA